MSQFYPLKYSSLKLQESSYCNNSVCPQQANTLLCVDYQYKKPNRGQKDQTTRTRIETDTTKEYPFRSIQSERPDHTNED